MLHYLIFQHPQIIYFGNYDIRNLYQLRLSVNFSGSRDYLIYEHQ